MVVPYMTEDWQRDDIVTLDEHNVVKAVGKYVLKQTLGKGSMGKVKLGIHIITGEKAAIKIVPRTTRNRKLTPKELSRELRAIREGHLMMLLNHPHIVYLRDMVAASNYYYFLMDYVSGGQLLHYIVKRNHLSEKHSRHFCRQMVSALDYMHRNSVVHRDLKIENILVDRTGRNIKIIDFGLSNLFCPERQLTTYCGSLYFAAPELLNGHPYRGPEIDVWSLGVVLYVMVTGSVPFDDKSLPGLHEKIKRAQVAYPAHVSTQCHDLLSHILIAEPQQRITLADIIRHPWLNEGRSGYTRNYLLYREPLSLPLDEDVLGRMTFGFNLGTVDDIRMKMEVILQSSVYRVSATHVTEIQSLTLANQENDKHSSALPSTVSKTQHQPTYPNTGALKSVNRAANHLIWGTYNDPQTVPAAYHPLLSIYYLTLERMKRLENQETGKSTMVPTTASKNLSPIQKPALQNHVAAAVSRSSLENTSVNIISQQLAPCQQPNQSHSENEPSANISTKDKENGPGHSRNSMDTTYHSTQILSNYPPFDYSEQKDDPPPLATKTHTHSKDMLATASTYSIPTSPILSTTQSISHSRSSSLSFTSLALRSSISKFSVASPPLSQTNQSIHTVSRVHLPLQNPMTSPKATSKRNTQLLTKLGALFRRRKNRYQRHHPYEHQQRYEQQPARQHQASLHSHNNHKKASVPPSSPPNLSLDSRTVLTETSDHSTELPSIPSPTLHFQHDLYQHQPAFAPMTSSISISSIRSPPENVILGTDTSNHLKDVTSQHHRNGSAKEENLFETYGHERSPSWLARRLSSWMDRAPILNRSTSGLGKASQA